MQSLMMMRKEAKELGIANYAKLPKTELYFAIEEYKLQDKNTEALLKRKSYSASTAKNLREREERTNARKLLKQKRLEEMEEKKRLKEEKKRLKEEKKNLSKEKKGYFFCGLFDTSKMVPRKKDIKFKAETSSLIFEALLKRDGKSFGTIARELGTHYNLVRRIARIYFVTESGSPIEKLSEADKRIIESL